MNVIVSNKQKNIIDNANIDAIKELNGYFQVNDLVNNLKNYFFTKMIIDATSIVEFANPNVLRKLVEEIGADKLVILLPPRPIPPKNFIDLLISLGIYNFSTDINDIIKFLKISNSYEDVINNKDDNSINNDNIYNYQLHPNDNNFNGEINKMMKFNNKFILGIKNITLHAGTTSLIYMLKQTLEYRFKKKVLAIEFNTKDFTYYKNANMLSVNHIDLEDIVRKDYDVILLDLNNNNEFEQYCNDVIYLIEPSIIKVNEISLKNPDVFSALKNKKVILNKSLISNKDIETFAREAGISFYFVLPPLNDRVGNSVIDLLIEKIGIC